MTNYSIHVTFSMPWRRRCFCQGQSTSTVSGWWNCSRNRRRPKLTRRCAERRFRMVPRRHFSCSLFFRSSWVRNVAWCRDTSCFKTLASSRPWRCLREVATRKNSTQVSVPCDWNDSFFILFTGINWSASLLLAATAGILSEDCICTLSCGAALGNFTLRELECFRQARVVN